MFALVLAACAAPPVQRANLSPALDPLAATLAQRDIELLVTYLEGTWETVPQPATQGDSTPMLLRFALIAEGHNPGVLSIGNKQDWDLAAGVLLVTETGGQVTTQNGQAMRFNKPDHHQPGLVAAQQKWHHALVAAVEKL